MTLRDNVFGVLTMWLLALVATPVAMAQTDVGHGGDSIICRPDPSNQFAGSYALDYLVTFRASNNNTDILPAVTWQASLARIGTEVAAKFPALAQSFNEFAQQVRNTNPAKHRVWREAPFGLINLRDEQLIELLPGNCMENGEARVTQAVIRMKPWVSGLPANKIGYSYVPQVFDDLAGQAPLQLSYLLVHEWLWDISDNVVVNRQLNRLLHSAEFAAMTPAEAREHFEAFGVETSGRLPVLLRAYGLGVCATLGGEVGCWGTAGEYSSADSQAEVRAMEFTTTSLCTLDDHGIQCRASEHHDGDVDPPALATPYALAVGVGYACASTAQGTTCWGQDFMIPDAIPLQRSFEILTKVSIGLCGVARGKLDCWGHDFDDIPALTSVTRLVGSESHGCAIDDGHPVCFGENIFGESNPPALDHVKDIAVGERHSCALTAERRVKCWGFAPAFKDPPPLDHPFAIAAGDNFTCAADRVGVKCWGQPSHDWPLDVPPKFRTWSAH